MQQLELTQIATKYGVKTIDGNLLVWWKERADQAHWYARFVNQIEAYHSSVHRNNVSDIERILTRYLPHEGTILEAGCGTGWVVAALNRRGYNVVGVDYSEALVTEVLRRFPNLPISVGDVCSLRFPDNYFSGYISLGVIEHRREGCDPFLHEAFRVVRPGAVLCISVPHFNQLRKMKLAFGAYRSTPRNDRLEFYQYGFTKDWFSQKLKEHGFDVVSFEYYGTSRCLQEEFPLLMDAIRKSKFLWRTPRLLRYLDKLGVGAHMIMAIVKKPEF